MMRLVTTHTSHHCYCDSSNKDKLEKLPASALIIDFGASSKENCLRACLGSTLCIGANIYQQGTGAVDCELLAVQAEDEARLSYNPAKFVLFFIKLFAVHVFDSMKPISKLSNGVTILGCMLILGPSA